MRTAPTAVTRGGGRPVGTLTRGTTNPNRLRRIDRWLAGPCGRLLRSADDPLVVDLGYGASGVTTVELAGRLRVVRADVEVVGIEISPARVASALPLSGPGLSFALGGFELGGFEPGAPVLAGRRPVLVRAANVLRQYPVEEVAAAWTTTAARLAPGGLLVDATSDEVGRRAAWVAVGAAGPVSLSVSFRLAGLVRPSDVAERLPKVLIHRNVHGERVHAYLSALDHAWDRAAAVAAFGVRQRFGHACRTLRDDGWPLLDGPARWRLGEVTVAWAAVAPS